MRCLQCSTKLPWLARLKNSKFCTEEHRKLYQETHDKTAFAELWARKKKEEPESPVDEEAVEEPERFESGEPASVEVATAASPDGPEEHGLAAGLGDESEMAGEFALPRSQQSLEPDGEVVSGDLAAIDYGAAGLTEEPEADLSALGSDADLPGGPEEEPSGDENLAERYARFLSMLDAERHYYQDLLERLPAGVAVIGEDMRVVYSNRLFREMRDQEGEEAGTISVTSPEVRNAIRTILSGEPVGNGTGAVHLTSETQSIRVEPITLMDKEETGATGVLLFATPTPARALAQAQ